MCGSQPCRPQLSRDKFEGQSAFALRAAVQAYLVSLSRRLYGLLFLEGVVPSVVQGYSQGLGLLFGDLLCSPL